MNQAVTTSNLPGSEPATAREWIAKLQLIFARRETKTVVARAIHQGPLRIQRPFYPERDCCHCYLLHPPGGIAAGDYLTLKVELPENTHALITTPAAGKIYTSDYHGHLQYQGIHAELEKDSCLEWLPQETIVFSGAKVELQNRFDLADNSQLIGWDMVCLGRRASGEHFAKGSCTQLIEIRRQGKLLMRERTQWQGGSESLQQPWGMGGHVVSGTMFATATFSRDQLELWREGLAALNLPGEWGLTQKPDIFVARFLGASAEQGRIGFEYLWQAIRPLINGRTFCRPRIWNT